MLVINQLTLIFSVDPICYHLNLNTKMYYRGMTAFFFSSSSFFASSSCSSCYHYFVLSLFWFVAGGYLGHPGLYISSDAGLSWHQALKGTYLYAIGDHGGVIVAVKMFQVNSATTELVSSDILFCFHQTPIHRLLSNLFLCQSTPRKTLMIKSSEPNSQLS